MSSGALPGFRDFYPAELAERSHIFATWREVARRFAFVEYDGPPLEPLELYTKKSGEEIVGQLYNFIDKGQREVALRPEMTPTLARMVAARANALRKPVRWFSIPQLFRYERQQRGRLREHFQLNMDIIGEADVTADAELLAAAIEIMRSLGLGPDDVRARVSDRRILDLLLIKNGVFESNEWIQQYPHMKAAVYAAIDKKDREPFPVIGQRLITAGLRPFGIEKLFELLTIQGFEQVRSFLDDGFAGTHLTNQFDRYLSYLKALGAAEWVDFDISIVRGLGYYTGTVFELFDAKGELRAICGGGRYDNLLGSLGGVEMPALGFGMGDVVIAELLRARGLFGNRVVNARLDFWVIAPGVDQDCTLDAMSVARDLRKLGFAVEYALRSQSVAKQMKAAHAAGARYAIQLFPEMGSESRPAIIRNMASGYEQMIPINDVVTRAAKLASAE